jgi:hypothetical protein
MHPKLTQLLSGDFPLKILIGIELVIEMNMSKKLGTFEVIEPLCRQAKEI